MVAWGRRSRVEWLDEWTDGNAIGISRCTITCMFTYLFPYAHCTVKYHREQSVQVIPRRSIDLPPVPTHLQVESF